MIRRFLTCAVCFLTATLATTGYCSDEFWAALGSYRTYDEAESARQQADRRLPESFSINEVHLESGLWYRVMSGPYLTQEIAAHLVEEAERQGFDSAWVLVRDSSAGSPLADYSSNALGAEPTSADEIDLEDFHLDMPDSTSMDIPGFNAPIRADSEEEHKLVDKAPAGYQLNQLHRN